MHEMSVGLFLANGAMIATFIGAGLAIGARYNGKHIKDAVVRLESMLQRHLVSMQAQHGTMDQHLVAMQQTMQQALVAVQQGNERIAQVLDRIDARADARHRDVLKHLRTA